MDELWSAKLVEIPTEASLERNEQTQPMDMIVTVPEVDGAASSTCSRRGRRGGRGRTVNSTCGMRSGGTRTSREVYRVAVGSKAGKAPKNEEDVSAVKKSVMSNHASMTRQLVRGSWWCAHEATGGDGSATLDGRGLGLFSGKTGSEFQVQDADGKVVTNDKLSSLSALSSGPGAPLEATAAQRHGQDRCCTRRARHCSRCSTGDGRGNAIAPQEGTDGV